MSNHHLAVSTIDQPPQFAISGSCPLYTNTSVLRKKAHDYAEETRAIILRGVLRKEATKPIDRRITKSTFELSSQFQTKLQDPHRFQITKPRGFPSINKSDRTLVGTTESIKKKSVKFTDQSSDFIGQKPITRSYYDLDRKHCDLVQSMLDGSDPDLSLSMDRFRQSSNDKKYSPQMRSSILFYTSSQKNPVILPNIDDAFSLVRNVDSLLESPKIDEFDRNDFNFFKDLRRLCEYENIHQKNIISSISRDLGAIHTENVGSISDDELLQMIYSLMIHIGGKILVNEEITKELLSVYDNEVGSCGNRELVLKMKVCTQKISKSDYIDLKTIIGHIRRIAIVYGYHKSVSGLSSLLSDMIFSTENSTKDYLDSSPSQLYEIIFKSNGPQTQLSAILELILYYYNIFF